MTEKMKAAVFEGDGKLVLKEVETPKVKRWEDVLLEVEAASVCGTDCQILNVPPGHPATPGSILGHEYLGKVLEVGTRVTHVKPGDRVVVDPNITCGTCAYCAAGQPNMCMNMTTLGIFMHGGFAKYNVAPASALYKIAPDLHTDKAIFAEPLSCVMNGARKIAASPGESVVILGAGPIGLYYTLLMKLAGAGKVIVAEISPFRAAKAKECGADIVINPKETDVRQAALDITGAGADIAIDAVGALVTDAIGCVRRGGRVLLFGMNSNARCDFKQFDITRNEISLIGTYISNHSFPPVIKLLESGRMDLAPLITHRLTLDNILDGVEAMRKGDAIEVIVTP